MKKFKAYTQKMALDERFYIEDENERDLIIEAETEADAEIAFRDYIKETSLYNEVETNLWLAKNPLYVVETA